MNYLGFLGIVVTLFTFSLPSTAQTSAEESLRSDFSKGQAIETRHSPIRRIVVFPFDVSPRDTAAAEKAWWKVREELTSNKRFLIASKQLMLRKDVLLAKKDLDRPTAILLGKHLEADALVTTALKDRELRMRVYSTESGSLLWTESLNLTTASPISEQIETASIRLVRDFVANIPYQGFLILDPLIGKPVYDEGNVKKAKVEVSSDSRVERGDLVQWLTVRDVSPVYQSNENYLVVAEGHVVDIDRDILTIEIKRLKEAKFLHEKSLVRIPKEVSRLREQWAIQAKVSGLNPEIVVAEMKAAQPDIQKHKGLATTGATLVSIIGLILLAF